MIDPKSAPRPDNWDALCAAWNDPAGWAREIGKYDAQLVAAGHPPVGVRVNGEREQRWVA